MKHTYYLLRALPDPVRGEYVNVGLVVCGERPRVLMTSDDGRHRVLHPNLADVDLAAWGADLSLELEDTPASAQGFLLEMFTGAIVVSAPGYLEVDSEADLEERTRGIFDRLVVMPQRAFKTLLPRPPSATSRLHIQLKAWFRLAKVYSSNVADLSRGKVVSSYPVLADEDLYADFALKNGAIHVIETLDLRGVQKLNKSLRGEVGLKSVLFDQAKRALNPGTRRIAVISADDYTLVRPLISMVHHYADDVVHIESAEDRQRLADFVAESLPLDELQRETLSRASSTTKDR